MKFHLVLSRCLGYWRQRGYSTAQLAKEVDCSVSSISHWANDRRPIEPHRARALFRVLASRLCEPNEKTALLELAEGYREKFPERSLEDTHDLMGQKSHDVSGASSEQPKAAAVELAMSTAQGQRAQALVVSKGLLPGGLPLLLPSLCLLLIVIFHTEMAFGLNSIWQQVWVNGQFAPIHLALWAFLLFFSLFFFLGLEAQGGVNRARWVEQGTWRNHYVSTVSYVLDTLDRWLLSDRRAKLLSPTSFSRNWSIELYEKALLFAILYPILAVMVQWLFTGSEQAFGQLKIWPAENDLWRRLLIFTTFVASVPIAFIARAQVQKYRRILVCMFAVGLNFVGYIACWIFYDGVNVGPGAVNMAAIAFICGIGLRVFDNVAVPTAAASIAGAMLSFAFLPILSVAEILTGKHGAGYSDLDVRLVHTLLNHSLNIVLFLVFLKILAKFINRQSIEEKTYFGVAIYTSAAVGTAILMFVAATQGFWTEYYLFLGLIPLMNGIFDFLSIGLTRYTLRLGSQNFGLKTIFMSIADLLLAFLLFLILVVFAISVMHLLDLVSGGIVFPASDNTPACNLDPILQSGATVAEPSKLFANDQATCVDPFLNQLVQAPKDFAWLIFIFASTLMPTLIHLGFALFALGPALLGKTAKVTIAQWSRNAHNDLFQRCAAAISFGIWLSIVTVTIALVMERLVWLLTGENGLFSALVFLFSAAGF